MKDWNDISDEEFDDALRDISLNHKEEVWPDAWPLMEEKLEEENRKRRFLIFWRSAAALLIFGALGIISTLYFKKENLETKHTNFENKNKKNIPLAENKTQKQIAQAENTKQKSVTNQVDYSKDSNSIKIQTGIKTEEKKKTNFAKKYDTNSAPIQVLAKDNLKPEFTQNNQIPNSTIPNDELLSQKINNETQSTQKPDLERTEEKTQVAISEKKSEIGSAKEIAAIKAEPQPQEAYFKEDTVVILTNQSNQNVNQTASNEISAVLPSEKTNTFQKFALNLGFSPDYSKVVASEFGPLGYNLQVILDYKISQKWALRAGVIKSLKLYDAYPEDYAWPVKWGKPSSPLREVEATCDMLDIPISLSYQILKKGSNQLYTTLGITNYKMINEKYEYFYENDADPNLKWRKWEGSSGFFGAGVVNMSLGIERKLTNFLSVQLEPFVKIPIKNVGFGNVKLLTTGLFLNIKTQAPKKIMQPK
ncbi:PorT family protein [Lacihabitans sp. CS3-21]|uniref:PorT family protein n=1 Tax=Lacihabitans sp. CS3-21 TaxID=2487332 RepID=UPI0020CD677D|nr:PorT family protein [Lacihabitans sp. CS3-21]MCP9748665.1 hypothetical protein [Lacihabitans sp. CS3-21]